MRQLIEVNNLSLTLGHKKVLDNISFGVYEGDFIGLIGPNGAGKTSLLKCLARLHCDYHGSVTLKGKCISDYSRRDYARQVSYVSQLSSPPFLLSVYDVIKMGLVPHKSFFSSDSNKDRQKMDAALDKVGLLHFKYKTFGCLSGGEQQRVLIAIALVQGAEIILLDEPTNHLDVFYQHQILQLLQRINVTVLISIHELNLASRYCKNLLLLHDGKLKATGAPEKLLKPEMLGEVFGLTCIREIDPRNNAVRVSFYME